MKNSFPKRERMVSKRLMDALFVGSRSMAAFPLRAIYLYKERARDDEPVQILISVPKKRFKHAVDRNRVKRQIREAYRRHKQLLHETLPAQQQLLLAFVWLSDRHLASAEVENRVQSLLRRIVEKEGDALTTRDS
jgi:ribonuclease P protein component